MKKSEKKLANYNVQVRLSEEDAKDVDLYCMIAPTADDAVEDKDSDTVCSNRS